tara:strand:- start:10312 stop:10920 length:609 start_codon:yes stop_codon:yes gene_type:complete
MKEYLFVLMIAVILMLIGSCKKNKEYFNPSINSNKENFEPNCSSIYGKYNPRCNVHSNLYHVGYYNHRDQKYPILDMNNRDKKKKGMSRFILNGKKLKPFSQKYWDKIFYFKRPFPYEKNIPYSFLFNFFFSGKIVNDYVKKTYFVFEKKVGSSLYKYVLFEYINGTLKHSFSLPDRNKINLGDVVFIRDRSSTLGPFTFIA